MLEELSLVLNITGSPDLVSSSAGALHGAEGDVLHCEGPHNGRNSVCVGLCASIKAHCKKCFFVLFPAKISKTS